MENKKLEKRAAELIAEFDNKVITKDEMRKRLMQAIASKPELLKNLNTSIPALYRLADHLMDNGVMIPVKCKECRFKRKYHKTPPICFCILHEEDTVEENFCSYGELKPEKER